MADGEMTGEMAEALVNDLLHAPSATCAAAGAAGHAGNFSFTFEHTPSASTWDATYAARFEPQAFAAELRHVDAADPTRSWSIRVGHGGNVYSMRTVAGETIPPQKHVDGAFVDEVWQSVAVALPADRAEGKWFVHQAGAYQRTAETAERPFFSPTLAKYCSAERRECGFVSWGQQAHLPTPHKSHVLYYTRYKDCGGGVLEMATGIHNGAFGGNSARLNYFNVPWGGVRASTFKSMLFAKADRSGAEQLLPIPPFSAVQTRKFSDTGGYVMWAEDLPPPAGAAAPTLAVPAGLALTMTGAPFYNDRMTVKMGFTITSFPVAPTVTVKTGCTNCALEITNQDGVKVPIGGIFRWAFRGNELQVVTPTVAGEYAALIALFKAGDVLTIAYPAEPAGGKPAAENKALALVFGKDPGDSTVASYGAASLQRDYTVFAGNENGWGIGPGHTHSARTYFATGEYEGMAGRADAVVDDVVKVTLAPGARAGRALALFAAAGERFGTGFAQGTACGAASAMCAGSTVPDAGLEPLFAIQCGAASYLGADLYHFATNGTGRAMMGSSMEDVKMTEFATWEPYRCEGLPSSTRPTWRLLGYFAPGACAQLENATFAGHGFCESMAAHTTSPTASPTVAPTAVPTASPTASPTAASTAAPTNVQQCSHQLELRPKSSNATGGADCFCLELPHGKAAKNSASASVEAQGAIVCTGSGGEHTAVHNGTSIADWERLAAEAHAKGMGRVCFCS